jgi:oligopeptidase A
MQHDVDTALDEADCLIDSVESAAAARTWSNTMAPLDEAETLVSDGYGVGPFLARAHPDQAIRAAAVDLEEQVAKWRTNLVFRRALYEALSEYAATDEAEALTGTRRRYLDFWLRDLRRAGHALSDEDRATLQRRQQRLVELEVGFATNLDAYEDWIVAGPEDLAGLPDDYVARLDDADEPGMKKVTLAYPDYRPFMEHSPRRDLRKALQHKFWNRAVEANRPLLEEAVALRDEIAELLGYDTWARYAIEVKMAKTPSEVFDFYDSIVPGLTKKAQAERDLLQARHEVDHPGDTMQSWDWIYHHTEQQKSDYGVDPVEVSKYFELESTIDGMFDITGEVFGLDYRRLEGASTWHPDVMVFEIRDRERDEAIAYFHADLFPRSGKFGHAAAFPLVYGKQLSDGTYRKPIAAILCNFTKPTADQPSLLTHNEALTLFHEFGHVLHFCLTTVDLVRFSGYDAEWDFVEAPSQIMEHWMWRPEVLQRFAKHHQSGEPIPEELVERLVAARDLNIGLHTIRQVSLGMMDMGLHARRGPKDLDALHRETYAYTQLPFHEDTFSPASFGHLMGGYDAGYYGYLWSKIYGDDMFAAFDEAGVLDPDVGRRYRQEILATGGSRDAMDHLRAFLGREPSTDAFLANLGLN